MRRVYMVFATISIIMFFVVIAFALVICIDPYEIDYSKYEMIKVGWSLQQVTNLLGPGTEIDISDVQTTPIFIQNREPFRMPVVNGYIIFSWNRKNYTIYIGFDNKGKVISKFFSDQNIL